MNISLTYQIQQAKAKAIAGQLQEMLATCQQIIETNKEDVDAQLDIGTLFLNFGYLAHAKKCFKHACVLKAKDQRALANLANLAQESGDHAEALRLYSSLISIQPNHPVIRRNFLVSQEYDPSVSDSERLQHARGWSEWVISQTGGPRPRPLLSPVVGRPLHIGYLSADFCQHTVGLFVKDIFRSHDPGRVMAFVYSAGTVKDWVTESVGLACTLREVSAMNDAVLAELVRKDHIDVLIDLSGHTAGSRLTVFARRPAPVLVSWLGYFATTGLPYIDAVLLDEWHAPAGMEKYFVEPIIRLPLGRFCYQPVPFAPEVAPLPCLKNRYITFGSFNNTAKLNAGVFDLWARVLASVPDSRLVLKWRTFNDDDFKRSTRDAFVQRGISPDRVELRGPSFHVDLLKEYGDIDICLDPFPFTGGLTSCEALWMGVPVVTWPQSRVVSRQTHAFLSAIGLPELSARDDRDYIRIATEWAHDRERLKTLRETLRQRMQASPLCNVTVFTRALEDTLISLYRDIEQRENAKKILLNVGAGHPKSGARIPQAFQTQGWKEIRLDIDPANEPDIPGTMLDMSAVAEGSVDAIYSSHNIEHLYPDEIPIALKEFLRVLKPGGYAVITCPDLQEAARMIAEDKLMDTAYQSLAGPVTPFDIVYSHRQFTGRDKPFMAHHCGFTLKVLIGTLKANGFQAVAGMRRPAAFDLWVVAAKKAMTDAELRTLAGKVMPECI